MFAFPPPQSLPPLTLPPPLQQQQQPQQQRKSNKKLLPPTESRHARVARQLRIANTVLSALHLLLEEAQREQDAHADERDLHLMREPLEPLRLGSGSGSTSPCSSEDSGSSGGGGDLQLWAELSRGPAAPFVHW